MELLGNLKNCGSTLFIDNFYISMKLCTDLLTHQTYVCGTLRANRRGNPEGVCKKKMKKGEVYGEQNQDGIRVIKWVDKRPVLMITSVPDHTDRFVSTGRKNRNGEDILKPPAIIAYNNAKKGVDISDQMSSYYTSLRKSIKWYKKVIFEVLLGTCIVNAWVIYNRHSGKPKIDILSFREEIIEGLLQSETPNTTYQEEDEDEENRPVNVNENHGKKRKRGKSSHRIAKYEGTARKNRKRCTECYKKIQQEKGSKEARAKASKVLTYCEDCEGHPTMCIGCFKEVHE